MEDPALDSLQPAGTPRPSKNSSRAPPLVCQVPGCPTASLVMLREYYQRYRICEMHVKLDHMEGPDGELQRFCQQCGRFQPLSAFDDNKRSCRERLARHNERRRRRIACAASAGKLSRTSGSTTSADAEHGYLTSGGLLPPGSKPYPGSDMGPDERSWAYAQEGMYDRVQVVPQEMWAAGGHRLAARDDFQLQERQMQLEVDAFHNRQLQELHSQSALGTLQRLEASKQLQASTQMHSGYSLAGGAANLQGLMGPSSSPAVLAGQGALPAHYAVHAAPASASGRLLQHSQPQLCGTLQLAAQHVSPDFAAANAQQFAMASDRTAYAVPMSYASGRALLTAGCLMGDDADRRPASWPMVRISEQQQMAIPAVGANVVMLQGYPEEATDPASELRMAEAQQGAYLQARRLSSLSSQGPQLQMLHSQGHGVVPARLLKHEHGGDVQMEELGMASVQQHIRVLGENQTLDSIWENLQLPPSSQQHPNVPGMHQSIGMRAPDAGPVATSLRPGMLFLHDTHARGNY